MLRDNHTAVSYGPFEAISRHTTNTNYCTSSVVKRTEMNSFNKMSQQQNISVSQKILYFEIPLLAPAKGTNSQTWLIPRLNGDKLKYRRL